MAQNLHSCRTRGATLVGEIPSVVIVRFDTYVVYPSDLTIVIWVQSDLLVLAQVQDHLHLLRSLSVPVGLEKVHIFVLFKGGDIN